MIEKKKKRKTQIILRIILIALGSQIDSIKLK